MSPGWRTTWHWHWPAHSNHPDLSWGSLIQAPASTQHHPLNFLVSQYPATQLTVMLLDTNFLRQWMVDVFVRGMMSSPPNCRFYRSSEAASRPHLLPAQHSHTTNQKFSAYPGLLPLSTQLSACSLQQTDKTFLNNEVTPSTRCTHTVAVDIQFNHHQESENKRMHA